jgi:hypothetical protein
MWIIPFTIVATAGLSLEKLTLNPELELAEGKKSGSPKVLSGKTPNVIV